MQIVRQWIPYCGTSTAGIRQQKKETSTYLSFTLNFCVESTRSTSIRILYDTYLGMVWLSKLSLSVLKTSASNTSRKTFLHVVWKWISKLQSTCPINNIKSKTQSKKVDHLDSVNNVYHKGSGLWHHIHHDNMLCTICTSLCTSRHLTYIIHNHNSDVNKIFSQQQEFNFSNTN